MPIYPTNYTPTTVNATNWESDDVDGDVYAWENSDIYLFEDGSTYVYE
jgi:hypothetical protein